MIYMRSLREQIRPLAEVRMESRGYALWLIWQGEANSVLLQTLQDYGGIKVAVERGQALWYFFSKDVFLAVARLEVWAKFNALPVTMQIFTATLSYGAGGAFDLDFHPDLWEQGQAVPQGFTIFVHPEAVESVGVLPGITLVKEDVFPGLAKADWQVLHGDARLMYQPSLGWYGILRPVGNPLDKSFQTGWREFFNHMESLLQRNKLRFTIHDNFLIFQLETLTQLKNWCRDFLTLIHRIKNGESSGYWPCVMAVADRGGMNFNNDLPGKIGLDWEQLMPDFPHLGQRNAILLGPEFTVHEVRFAISRHSAEDWCNVSLNLGQERPAGMLPTLVPGRLILGSHAHCFYCGQRSHESASCPTRGMEARDPNVWKQVAALDFAMMKDGVTQIDAKLAEDPHSLDALLKDSGPTGIICRAIFDICSPMQVRGLPLMWRVRGKEYPAALTKDLVNVDDNPIWERLAEFPKADLHKLDKELQNLAVRFPRDARGPSLLGFVAMERGDFARAASLWKEAEVMSPPGLAQAWNIMLQARCAEMQGRFAQASALYGQARQVCPKWLEPEYRILVCQVKSGFADKAAPMMLELINRDPHLFNRILLDPEMERGHIQMLSSLFIPWMRAETEAEGAIQNLNRLQNDLPNWFIPDHEFNKKAAERIKKLLALGAVHNFVPYHAVIQGLALLERDMQSLVQAESKDFKNRFRGYAERLNQIRDEAAWFPFPKAMVEFNKSYNLCAANLNWALQSNLNGAEQFRKAQVLAEEEEERIKKMESRLKFLRLVRDGTLFSLVMAKTFFWLEIICLALILLGFPLLLYYGENIGAEWAAGVLSKQSWQVQQAAIVVVSMLALGIAALRTILRFETIRERVFAAARRKQEQRGKELAKKSQKLKTLTKAKVDGKLKVLPKK